MAETGLPNELRKEKALADRARDKASKQSARVKALRQAITDLRSSIINLPDTRREAALQRAMELDRELEAAAKLELELWDRTRQLSRGFIKHQLDMFLATFPEELRSEMLGLFDERLKIAKLSEQDVEVIEREREWAARFHELLLRAKLIKD